VIINCVYPGWCKTEPFRTHNGGVRGWVGLRLIGRTAEAGNRALVPGIAAGRETHGKYVSECRVKSESTLVRSEEGARTQGRVWTELVEILESIRTGVTSTLLVAFCDLSGLDLNFVSGDHDAKVESLSIDTGTCISVHADKTYKRSE